jgi:hypothetical protein
VKAKRIPPCRLYYLTHLANSLQRFTDATIQDKRIRKLFEHAIENVTKSMQQINARRAGNMPLTAFFRKIDRRATENGKPRKLERTTERQAKKPKTTQSLTSFFADAGWQ